MDFDKNTRSLKNFGFPSSINTSKDNLISDFFVPALKNSVQYDRGVGFFSSGWVKEAYIGMMDFARNSGRARWITSPILSKRDWDALITGHNAKTDAILKASLEWSINQISITLQKDALVALAWMIADGIVTFKLAKPKNKLNSEYHAKVGIFTDPNGDRISFDGSYNDSINGLLNVESIKIFRSWDTSASYVESEVAWYDDIWNNRDPNIDVFDLPEAAKKKIIKFRENSDRPYPKPAWVDMKSYLKIPEIKLPELDIPVDLRDYQIEAIEAWFANGSQGLLEMATGTGKTITALSCVIELMKREKRVLVLITCPYLHLVQQWASEAEKFGFRPIMIAESKRKWLPDVSKILRDFDKEFIDQAVLITTNKSLVSSTLLDMMEARNVLEQTFLIADEAHHTGSTQMLMSLPSTAPWRLGLSATPIRKYDDEGTDGLLRYYNNVIYSFDLRQAIDCGYLTPYYYYPTPVEMTEEEFVEYLELTKKLIRQRPEPDGTISESAKKIAIMRARVQNNSENKLVWLDNNIHDTEELRFALFYVGEQIFEQARALLGYDKRIPLHEFTHRQTLKDRKNILDKFENEEIKALIAMKCLDEGVDVPPTQTAYFLASSSVPREFVQRRGRILRNYPGKKYAYVHDLISIPPIDYIDRGKDDPNYNSVRSAVKREYRRIKEFAELAENKYQALNEMFPIIDSLDLLDT